VSDELDISRLAKLEELVGSSVAQIVETLVTELDRALGGVKGALREGDLRAAALAAHAARNSALMIDSQPLLRGLDALEQSARDDDLAGAQAAQGRLLKAWPAIRVELQRAAG
jgi:hypothetical protein